jgi:valyl-tRNA synthetase
MKPQMRSEGDANKLYWTPFGVASGAKTDDRYPVATNTSPKFDIGRNFCNKLWNAARFALSNLETVKQTDPVDASNWSIFDRWILSRLCATIDEVNEALRSYRFDAYAKACYDFFWRDLCDWYIEAIKPAMKDPNRAGQTSAILSAALDGALRLMHPVLPFITETLFLKLNEVRKERAIPGVLELKPSGHLINAAWPRRLNGAFGDAEASVAKLQEIIIAIRNLRNEHKVDPRQTVDVQIKGSALEADVKEAIELLAACKLRENAAIPTGAIRLSAGECEIFVSGLADEAAEKQRIAKRGEELKKSIAALKGRLANESYIAKAPPHLVQQTKDQLAAAERELNTLK